MFFFTFFLIFFFVLFVLFSVILVPELFRKVRETPGKKIHQVSSKSEVLGPSYDQKTVYTGICVKTPNPCKIKVWRTLLTGGVINAR